MVAAPPRPQPVPGRARTHRGVQVAAMSTEIIGWLSHRRRRLAVELRARRWYAVEVPNKAAKLTTLTSTSTATPVRAVARDEDDGWRSRTCQRVQKVPCQSAFDLATHRLKSNS
jgi:hypothetical protein